MKTTAFSTTGTMGLVFFFFLSFIACRKETAINPTEEDAADAIENAIAASSGGAAEDMAAASQYTYNQGYGKQEGINSLQCGVPFDTAVSLENSGIATTSFLHAWTALLNCNGFVPESVSWTGTYTGSYDAPRLTGSTAGSRNWTISGLGQQSIEYTLNGTTSRTGSHTSKVRNKYTFSHTLTTTYTNLQLNKTTHRITGGTADVQATLMVSTGNSRTFSGEIVFSGDGTAILTINGKSYIITIY